MSAVFIHGIGAVSPAGWGVPALCEALDNNVPLPVHLLARPGWENQLRVRPVPPPLARLEFLAHPRMRRAGVLAQHTTAAALEALGPDAARVRTGALRLGVIVCTLAGSVTYSRRFYEEVLQSPATASPLIFPETVFNAPASHLAACLNSPGINYTLVGDEGSFLQGLALAADWLAQDRADGCVVVGAEELDWIAADAARLFCKSNVYAGGAGALYLKNHPHARTELSAITDSFSYTPLSSRASAMRRVRSQLGLGVPNELHCASGTEASAWPDWPGAQVTPRAVLGAAFNASAAWQCVVACDQIANGRFPGVCVTVSGASQQAIGARFVNPEKSIA